MSAPYPYAYPGSYYSYQPQYALPPWEMHSAGPSSELPSQSQDSHTSKGQKKKNRWTDTEEKILIELFGENEERLRYKSFNSPEWQSIARQLHSKCREESVESDKTPQQCKNKMANLTKKYKGAKDKLRSTGYGRGGDVSDNESEGDEGQDLIPKHFNDIDEIMGKRESVDPRHVLESSSHVVDVNSSPEISQMDRDIQEKEGLDEEIYRAARNQRKRSAHRDVSPQAGTSSECAEPSNADNSDDDKALDFAKSLFFKSKGKNKKPLTSTPKQREADVDKKPARKRAAEEKPAKRSIRKKGKGPSGVDEPTLLSFLERAQERDEAFMERMAEADRQHKRDQQKFSMDALAMLGNILKDVGKGKE